MENKDLFINRELSQLEFCHRVLQLAQDERLPLLARLRFLFICSGVLDEFFEVRVAELKQHLPYGRSRQYEDSWNTGELLNEISKKTHLLALDQYETLNNILLPALNKEGIRFLAKKDWSKKQKTWVKNYFNDEILPVISPIALDIAHPFPRLANKSLNFIVTLKGKDAFGRSSGLAIVHAPRSIPRVISIPKELRLHSHEFFFLTEIIHAHAEALFPGMKITGCYQFRVTRNSDLLFDKEEIEDLAMALKTSLLSRSYGNAVRLEIAAECPQDLSDFLLDKHNLSKEELYCVNGPVNLHRFMMVLSLINRGDLDYPEFTPTLPKTLQTTNNLFEAIKKEDILLHHPYQSFEPVIELIRQATVDPDVLAIKQTLYRTGVESQMVRALIDAARAGKEVTAVVELRARFDEASNIELANRLQEAGALVVYGIVGYKTHGKMTLVVRREQHKLKRYIHLGTGNYHARTAKEYTDVGLLTCNKEMGADVQSIFQLITGMGDMVETRQLTYSPYSLAKTFHRLILEEEKQALDGKPARIVAKMNALTDGHIIKALYRASQAGVTIELIIRGMCCLRPGIPGLSDNISVRCIMGRFLEHSRIFYFYHGGKELIYCGSADWMEKKLYRRIETCFPITNQKVANNLKDVLLNMQLKDDYIAWSLQSDGTYKKIKAKHPPGFSSQLSLMRSELKK